MENKYLSRVLEHIKEKQKERDKVTLTSKGLNKREKKRLKEQMGTKRQRKEGPEPERPGNANPTFLLGREPDICTLV